MVTGVPLGYHLRELRPKPSISLLGRRSPDPRRIYHLAYDRRLINLMQREVTNNSLDRVIATVDAEIRPGHEARSIRGQEQRSLSDFIGLSEAIQKVLRPERLARFLH